MPPTHAPSNRRRPAGARKVQTHFGRTGSYVCRPLRILMLCARKNLCDESTNICLRRRNFCVFSLPFMLRILLLSSSLIPDRCRTWHIPFTHNNKFKSRNSFLFFVIIQRRKKWNWISNRHHKMCSFCKCTPPSRISLPKSNVLAHIYLCCTHHNTLRYT